MSPLARVLLVVAGLLGVLLIVIATREETFHIERQITVSTEPSLPFAEVADFHRWADWSPWAKLDPNQKTTLTGTPGTVGSSYAWVGNDKVGEGRMTVAEIANPEKIAIKLEFLKPFPAENVATFTFAKQGSGTRVVWAMDGHRNFMAKAMSLVMDMDKMIGPDFEHGLAGIKEMSEKAAAAPAPAAVVAPAPAK